MSAELVLMFLGHITAIAGIIIAIELGMRGREQPHKRNSRIEVYAIGLALLVLLSLFVLSQIFDRPPPTSITTVMIMIAVALIPSALLVTRRR